jgi:two-component system, cell cycle sensor histidine kinase and response regulator CckA
LREGKRRPRFREACVRPGVPTTLLVRQPDGKAVPVELLALPLRYDGRPATQLVLREIGAGQEPPQLTAEQLRQAQKMDAVGRLASGIAHDFNNILTAIRGHAEILLEDLPPDMAAREDALDIQRAAERAGDLTRQLLMFARGRAGEPVRLDLNQVVREVEKLLRRLIRTDVGLRTDLQPELPATMADPGQLQQVVLNLVVNASEAVDRNGLIVVRTRAVQLREPTPGTHVRPGAYVQLCVSDNGPGIAAEVREQLFEPFFTTKPQGTGLGLSTVHGIVTKCGGKVGVRSEHGRGTTFEVLLPAAPEQA